MRSIILFASLLLTQAAMASAPYPLQKGDRALSPITGEIVSVQHKASTDVNVLFTLNGCMDRLVDVPYEIVEQDDGSVDIFLSALNVATDQSTRVYCIAPNFKTITIPVQGKLEKEQIRLHFLGGQIAKARQKDLVLD